MFQLSLQNVSNENSKISLLPDCDTKEQFLAIIVSENNKPIVLAHESEDSADAVFNINKSQIEVLYNFLGTYLKQIQ